VSADDVARFLANAQAKGAKDLVVETEAAGVQPSSYAVVPTASLNDGGVIALQIKLRHQ
jgi:hypothetical protein